MPAALGWVSAGFGQEGAEPPPAAAPQTPPGHGGQTDVYINDSFEANEMIESARRLAEQDRWDEAARLLHRAITEFGERLLRVGPRRYGPVAEQANRMIASWPPEGLATYRNLFDEPARRAYAELSPGRDRGTLHRLLERYYCTATGVEIADVLAQLSIEVGAFADSEAIYRRLLRDHPDVRRSPEEILARLSVVAALSGDAPAARQWVDQAIGAQPDLALRWAGQPRQLRGLVDALLENPPAPSVGQSFAWPTFGGARHRNRGAGFRVDQAASLWRTDGVGAGLEGLLNQEEQPLSLQRALERGRLLTMHAVAADGFVFVQHAFSVRAIAIDSGAVGWTYTPFSDVSVSRSEVEASTIRWYCPTYDRGRLYQVFGDEEVSYYGDRVTGTSSVLVCVDAATGAPIWKTRDIGFDEEFGRCVFDPTPTVLGDHVFVVARRRRTFGFEDCYLCRLNAWSGELEFRVHLGGASTGGFGYRRPTLSIPAVAGGAIIVATNLGTVAAVNAQSGAVIWLTQYSGENRGSWGTRGARVTAPWHFNPVLADGDHVICYPVDSPSVLVLNAATGEIVSEHSAEEIANPLSILGVRDGVLYGLGETVFAYDLAKRDLRWTSALPEGEQAYGRALLTDDRLMVPTRSGLSNFSLTGELASRIPWELPADAGNVVPLEDRLIVVANDRVTAYARKHEVWAKLREMMVASPEDPLPALELAEVALRGDDTAESLTSLEDAIARAGGLATMVTPELRGRVFDHCLALAERFTTQDPPQAEVAVRILGYAAQCAPHLDAEVVYRIRLAELHQELGRPQAAVELYQQLIADRSLRWASPLPAEPGPQTPGEVGRRRIERLIELYGPEVYAPFENRAQEWLRAGVRAGDLSYLERVTQTFPNARAAPRALVAAAKVLRGQQRPLEAVRRLSLAYRRYGKRVDTPRIMRLMADCYADAGQAELAWNWLTKAARRFPGARVEQDGRSLRFEEYRTRLGDAVLHVEPARLRMKLPLQQTFTCEFAAPVHLLEPRHPSRPRTPGDAAYFYSDAGLHCLQVAGGAHRWATPASCRMKPELLMLTSDRAVFATRHQVFALQPEDGRRVWEYGKYPADLTSELTDHEMFSTFRVHALGRDRLVCFQDSGLTGCVSLDSGERVWELNVDPRCRGAAVMADTWLAYTAKQGGRDVYVILDVATGEVLSQIEPPDDRNTERLEVVFDNLLVVTSQSLRLYAPYTAELIWQEDRGRHIIAETFCLDLEGVYFSDDGRNLVKIDLDTGRTTWRSDRLPFRFADGVSASLDRDQIIVSTEKGVASMDTFDGRLRWEATLPPDALLGRREVTDTCVVALDTRITAPAGYSAFFLDHRHGEGRIASPGGLLELGSFDGARQVTVRDQAILLMTEQTVHGWYHAPATP
ncbi:MAG: PQQ-binding-like beta-propeller repeat protein [bacterium]|nr:PQQ-binding-like beta-propeller repeat protein [bacterium]